MFAVFSRMWPELKSHRWRLAWIIFLGFVMSACTAAIPQLIQYLMDHVYVEKNHDELILAPFVLFGLWLVQSLARYFHMYGIRAIADTVIVKLRKDLLEKYLVLSPSYLGRLDTGTGGLISRMLNDINLVYNGVTLVADLIREPVLLVLLVGNLIWLDWQLTLLSALGFPLVAIILSKIKRSLRKHAQKNQRVMEDVTLTLKESLDGVRVIQSFNLEGEMKKRFDNQIDRFLSIRKKIISREEFAGPISEVIAALVFSILLYYIGLRIFSGHMTIGEFGAYLTAVGMAQKPLKKVQDAFVKMQQTNVALDRLDEILKSNSQVPEVAQPKPFPSTWQEIVFKNVSFAYGDEITLKNVNLTVKRGEVIALVGESGSGKSTLVNLLERFFDPTAGDILIDGVSIREFSLKELRAHIALVTQEVFLFSDTIERNIHAGDFSKPASKVKEAAVLSNAHNFIEKTQAGYQTSVGDRGSRISGGEKQRLSIARALLKDAPILILDEATSALDSASELEVQKGLEKLLEGRTAFIIAHRLSTVKSADRILVLKKGEIVEQGSHQQLLERDGEYSRFHRLQIGLS